MDFDKSPLDAQAAPRISQFMKLGMPVRHISDRTHAALGFFDGRLQRGLDVGLMARQ